MVRQAHYASSKRVRWVASGICLGGLAVGGLGCSQFRPSAAIYGPPGDPQTSVITSIETMPAVVPAAYHQTEKLPAILPDIQQSSSAPGTSEPIPFRPQLVAPNVQTATPVPAQATPVLPIGLDTVFRLAAEQNAQIGLAQARLQEACAQRDVAAWRWLPDFYVGTSYYRHEGGIANEDGTLTVSSFGSMFAGGEISGRFDAKDIAFQQVNAQRQVWQQKGELSKVTSQTFLDASTTYIDWLTARSGESVALRFRQRLADLLDRAEKVAAQVSGTAVEVARIRAEVDAEDQAILKLRQQQQAAQAKLLYVLGLDPCSTLVPIDVGLLPFDLIDATPPVCDLVAQALRTGPGIQEMQGLLNLIHQSIERAQGPGKYMPIFELHLAEGGFGTGPGDRMDWDNRFDLGLQARWNLTELVTARDRQRVAQAKVQQAEITYRDLQGKLTAGVQEAREAIVSGKSQMQHTRQQIEDASKAFDLSDRRLRAHIQGSSYTEALLALESYGRAERNYLEIVNAYDKAQLRLMVLLGPSAVLACTPPAPPPPPPAVAPTVKPRGL